MKEPFQVAMMYWHDSTTDNSLMHEVLSGFAIYLGLRLVKSKLVFLFENSWQATEGLLLSYILMQAIHFFMQDRV